MHKVGIYFEFPTPALGADVLSIGVIYPYVVRRVGVR
jgi:hypothetical protein